MGEAPDFTVGDRIDLMPSHVIVGTEPYELLFKGEITFLWADDRLDVRAGEQVFRVQRRRLLLPRDQGGPYYFRPEGADEMIEAHDYNPEAEIDYDREDIPDA